jgi:signal peptidase I
MNDTDAAILAAEPAPAAPRGDAPARGKGEWIDAFKTLLVVAVAFLGVRTALYQPFTIPSASMEPNLLEGDYIVVSKFAYGLSRYSIPLSPALFGGRVLASPARRGDIVVFKLPRDGRTDYVKRVIGLPGDRIQMRDGVVWLNGTPLARQELAPGFEHTDFGYSRPVHRFLETLPDGRSYVTWGYGSDGDVDNTGVYVVPPGHYFVMGDNRDNSEDSRYPEQVGVGYVPAENLVGRADLVMFSLANSGLRPERLLKALH